MLKFYSSFPFIPQSEIIQVDLFTGNGALTSFELRGKSSTLVGSACQVDANLVHRYLQGFSFTDSTHIVFLTAPPLNSQIVVPGTNSISFVCFDTASEPGRAGAANVDQFKFWLADDGIGLDSIISHTYMPVTGKPGIAIFFQNMATAAGASTMWTQLACCDAAGNALSYQATATTLHTASFQALTSLSATAGPSSNTITVNSASGFYAGDYVILNPAGGSEERFKLLSINYGNNTMVTTGLNYSHSATELVIMNGKGFSAQGTLPLGLLSGVAESFINLVMVYDCYSVTR